MTTQHIVDAIATVRCVARNIQAVPIKDKEILMQTNDMVTELNQAAEHLGELLVEMNLRE